MKKTLLQILNFIGAITLYLIIVSLGIHLVTSKIIVFRWDWFEYIYYFGLGILLWHPSNYLLNYYKKL